MPTTRIHYPEPEFLYISRGRRWRSLWVYATTF